MLNIGMVDNIGYLYDEDYDKNRQTSYHLNILFIDDILDIFDENRVGAIRILK